MKKLLGVMLFSLTVSVGQAALPTEPFNLYLVHKNTLTYPPTAITSQYGWGRFSSSEDKNILAIQHTLTTPTIVLDLSITADVPFGTEPRVGFMRGTFRQGLALIRIPPTQVTLRIYPHGSNLLGVQFDLPREIGSPENVHYDLTYNMTPCGAALPEFQLVKANFGRKGVDIPGDLNLDNKVDLNDFGVVKQKIGFCQ